MKINSGNAKFLREYKYDEEKQNSEWIVVSVVIQD